MLFSNCAYVAAGFLFGGVVAGSLWGLFYLARLKLNAIRRQYELEQALETLEAAGHEGADPFHLRTQVILHDQTHYTAAEPIPEVYDESESLPWTTSSATRELSATTENSCRSRWKHRKLCSAPRRRLSRTRR